MILYNADGEPLGERDSFEQHVARIHRREFRAMIRRGVEISALLTIGILIGSLPSWAF